MRTWLFNCDRVISRHWPLFVILALLIGLRIPNFTEPYWYGDEGIYLALGTALRHGERLYAEIIDHKTPLIYYLAMTPHQWQFRLLMLGWMLVTTAAFYGIARRLWSASWISVLATLAFMLLTTLPAFEGNIPNGELFVMGFVLVGGWILFQTPVVNNVVSAQGLKPSLKLSGATTWLWQLLAGVLLGLGILTKVPALFDVLAFLSIFWFGWLREIKFPSWPFKLKWQELRPYITGLVIVGIGIVLPIALSIVYYVWRGSGQAYLDYGLLYNFRYAGNWNLPFTDPILLALFTLMGKAGIMFLTLGILTVLTKWLHPAWQWSAAWFVMAVFAALLSNRPYPHYFLQVMPPLVLLLGSWLALIKHWGVNPRLKRHTLVERPMPLWSQNIGATGIMTLMTVVLVGGWWGSLKLLGFGFYPTNTYYQNWAQLVTGQISEPEYRSRFNWIMDDNYRASEIIKSSQNPYLFIWGTNPMLYAQTQKVPTGRFTVSFHIKDFNAYQETIDDVINRQPEYIVVMNNENQELPGLSDYLSREYMPHGGFDHFVLWKRL